MDPLQVVEFRDLRWAIVTSQHRSLRQAAEALSVRQSTLSRCLRNLEYQLKADLFERTNGGTRPTPAGQEFLEAARRVLEETQAITERLRTRSRGESGRLTIGVHASLSAGNLRATLIDFRRRFPDVATYLVDGSSDHLISDLVTSAIDVAFVVEGNPRLDGKSLPVWSERVVVALPEEHPLGDREFLLWNDLRNEPLLLPLRGPGPEILKLIISKSGCSNPCRLTRHDVSLDRFLTLVGAGWGLLLALEGATGATYPGVTFREVHDADGPARLSFRAHWREENGNPSLRPFLHMLRERYPDLSGAGAPG
ncbi:LysR family transcriptional regulator [Acidomonas methanolica]|uniref:LysR substrate-binding domain-containing protein n=1 Tax=Acidomonas methanolica TaxID=437 RepID=UPI002119C68F|nr:LysR family transcriptional regulator [Acidomonas methanolica]MCQ9155163.1 LysR family transcriptional regulator [Acidomonas methanolica]